MTLAQIERSYGSYTEYTRCMEEEASYRAEQEAKAFDYYSKNKKLLKKAEEENKRIDFAPDVCRKCPHYTDIGPTWGDGIAIDDWDHGRCENPTCKTFIENTK